MIYIGEPDSEDVATTCDDCGTEIPFEVTCHLVYTGEILDGCHVAKIVCSPCYAKDNS